LRLARVAARIDDAIPARGGTLAEQSAIFDARRTAEAKKKNRVCSPVVAPGER
jgi:hypothetical protein